MSELIRHLASARLETSPTRGYYVKVYAPVAQGTEQGLPKPRVGGSIPPRRVCNIGVKLDVQI